MSPITKSGRNKFILLGILCLAGGYFAMVHRPWASGGSTAKAQPSPMAPSPNARPINPPKQAETVQDYEPPLSKKVEAIIEKAISEKWPNMQLRALISMTRDPRLIAELWKRDPLEGQDLCVLAMHGETPEQRCKAAELWAGAAPDNAEPKYILLLERLAMKKNPADIIPELYEVIELKTLDSYFPERSLAFDFVANNYGLSPSDGIMGMYFNKTNSKAYNIINLLAQYATTMAGSGVTEKEELAGLVAGMATQIENKRALKFQEYQSAIVSEFQVLNQLDDQTEYGRQGFTVTDRKKELSQKSVENMAMQDACINAWATDRNLGLLFQQRSQALGEYEAYRQIYALIKSGTK